MEVCKGNDGAPLLLLFGLLLRLERVQGGEGGGRVEARQWRDASCAFCPSPSTHPRVLSSRDADERSTATGARALSTGAEPVNPKCLQARQAVVFYPQSGLVGNRRRRPWPEAAYLKVVGTAVAVALAQWGCRLVPCWLRPLRGKAPIACGASRQIDSRALPDAKFKYFAVEQSYL